MSIAHAITHSSTFGRRLSAPTQSSVTSKPAAGILATQSADMPKVPIHEADLRHAFASENIPHQVVCELPAQLLQLESACGASVRDLVLRIRAPLDSNELSAIAQATLACTGLASLTVGVEGETSMHAMDALCFLLAAHRAPLQSIELSLDGPATEAPGPGVEHFLCNRTPALHRTPALPALRFTVRGSLATPAVAATLAQLARGRCSFEHLKFAGIASGDEQQLAELLSRLQQPCLNVEVELEEFGNPDAFMRHLLEQGTPDVAKLVVKTPDGRSVLLSATSNAIEEKESSSDHELAAWTAACAVKAKSLTNEEFTTLIVAYTKNGRVDSETLLSHCMAVPGGAQLYARALARKVVPDLVPIATGGDFIAALQDAGARCVIGVRFPSDHNALANFDLKRIRLLRFTFEEAFDSKDTRLKEVGSSIARMTNLEEPHLVHREQTTKECVDWFCKAVMEGQSEATPAPICSITLEVSGASCSNLSRGLAAALNLSTLELVRCSGTLAASLTLSSCRKLQSVGLCDGTGFVIDLTNLSKDDARDLPHWLEGLRDLGIAIRFKDSFDPADLTQRLLTQIWGKKATLRSLVVRMPDRPRVDLVYLAGELGKIFATLGKDSVGNDDVDGLLRSFAASVADGAGQPADMFRRLFSQIELKDLISVGSTTKRSRSELLEIAALRWATNAKNQRLARDHCERILRALLGRASCDAILNAVW